MVKSAAYAAFSATEPMRPWQYEVRDPKDDDVVVEVHYCGICHSDMSFTRSEWFSVKYPIVPGHEFTGVIKSVGKAVTSHKVGEKVAVGVPAGGCEKEDCGQCKNLTPQYCPEFVMVYGSMTKEGEYTQGGYGRYVVVPAKYVNKMPENLPMDKAAPLMCAGITVYSPMAHNGLKKGGKKVGVVGIGGLGHLAVQFAAAWGNEVWAISRSTKKEEMAKKLGAKGLLATSDADAMSKAAASFDYVIDTVSGERDLCPTLNLLKADGVYNIVGAPPSDKVIALPIMMIIMRRLTIQGSATGGVNEAQEMLDFCAEKNILPYVEVTTEDKVNEAFDRLEKADVEFRFVLDVKNTAPQIEVETCSSGKCLSLNRSL